MSTLSDSIPRARELTIQAKEQDAAATAVSAVVARRVEGGLVDRAYRLRDRWLASPAFQKWAAGSVLTRHIARRQTRQLFDLCAGFVYSQVLLACVQLKVFDHLGKTPLTAADLAQRIDVPLEATERLLAAAVALDLVDRRSTGRFGLGALGAVVLGNPAVTAMIEHHALLYSDLRDPVAVLRGGSVGTALGRYWSYATASAPAGLANTDVADYSLLMASSQALIAEDILDAYPMGGHRALLDVGGGEGAFAIQAATRHPELQITVFDLPAVAQIAATRFADAGLAGRVTASGGDFKSGTLPSGSDCATLIRVLFDHDDATVATILAAVRRALPSGGVLLISEPMSGTPGAEPIADAYFAFYLMAMGRGKSRSLEQIRTLLVNSGFSDVRAIPTRRPLMTSLVVARAGGQ
jgi:demethylspheroidene O-methyltransferase